MNKKDLKTAEEIYIKNHSPDEVERIQIDDEITTFSDKVNEVVDDLDGQEGLLDEPLYTPESMNLLDLTDERIDDICDEIVKKPTKEEEFTLGGLIKSIKKSKALKAAVFASLLICSSSSIGEARPGMISRSNNIITATPTPQPVTIIKQDNETVAEERERMNKRFDEARIAISTSLGDNISGASELVEEGVGSAVGAVRPAVDGAVDIGEQAITYAVDDVLTPATEGLSEGISNTGYLELAQIGVFIYIIRMILGK